MSTMRRRRARGEGGVYQKHAAQCPRPKRHRDGCDGAGGCGCESTCRCTWWIAFVGPDGTRWRESSYSHRKGDAVALVRKRTGAVHEQRPVIRNAERLTFDEAARDVVTDFEINAKRSIAVARRRIEKHLAPFFSGRRLTSITVADVRAYIAKRRADVVVVKQEQRVGDQLVPAVTKPVANATINRELQTLRRVFSLAIQGGRIATKPHIALLREAAPRSGFFDRAQVDAVISHLPSEIRPVILFAFLTGWRLASEILTLEWRQVDFAAGEVRLLPGQTKNGEGRVFPMTAELRRLLEDRKTEHDDLKRQGRITPLVFFRLVAEGRGGELKPRAIVSFTKAWRVACTAAGCPGRIPHDLRRSAVRSFTRAGISEHVSMKLSGHLTPSVFRRYDIVSEGDLRSAASALDNARDLPQQRIVGGEPTR
jgi:integrase